MKKQTLLKDIQIIYSSFKELHETTDNMLALFEKEYRAATAHDLLQIEEIIAEKNRLFDIFSQKLLFIFKSVGDLDGEHQSNQIKNLSEMKAYFLNLKESFKEDAFFYPEISLMIQKIQKYIDDFLKRSKEIKSSVQKNKLIVDRLLGFHRESFHFWQKLISERTKSYDEKGHMKPAAVNQLSIKA